MTAVDRTPLDITFILEQDPSDNTNDMADLHRHGVLSAMKKATDFVGLEKYDTILQSGMDFRTKMIKSNLPEIWLHDARGDSNAAPFVNYYIVNFDDDSRIMFVLLIPEYDEIQGDPMIQ